MPLGLFVGFILILPALGVALGQAFRGGHNSPRYEGKRTLDRLFDFTTPWLTWAARRGLILLLGASPFGRKKMFIA